MPMTKEKEFLPSSSLLLVPVSERTSRRKLIAYLLITFCLLRYILLPIYFPSLRIIRITFPSNTFRPKLCEQAEAIYLKLLDVNALMDGNEKRCLDWLSGAVRVPTEIFDDMGDIGVDDRWEAFYGFSECESSGGGLGVIGIRQLESS